MDLSTIAVVAFDCDGVMFDTEATNRIFYNTILEAFHLPPMTDAQFRFVHMATVGEALAHLFQGRVELAEVRRKTSEFDYSSLIPEMVMEPHLKALLQKLTPTYKRAIATNRSNTMAGVLEIHGLTGDFELVVTSSDVENAKPAPDQLHLIMEHFDVKASEILYIGDSPTDQLAARAAQVPFIAFGNPELEADFHMSRLCEVEELLKL